MSYRRIWPHQTIEEYGFNGGRPIIQVGSSSGFLLDWAALDERAWAVTNRRACRYVVVGETIHDKTSIRLPELMRLRP